ncbi:hypothetical protein ACVWYQ_001096 [Bradyrhizobium sp. USDA 3397]
MGGGGRRQRRAQAVCRADHSVSRRGAHTTGAVSRTAKSCGPGARGLCAKACGDVAGRPGPAPSVIRKATGAIVHRSPGRARHKPSTHCAGKAGCLASPVCRCAAFSSTRFAQWTAGASRHPAFPAPSAFSRVVNAAKLGRTLPRGCEPMPANRRRSRAPDAAQHEVMRCRAGAHVSAVLGVAGSRLCAATLTRCSLSGTRRLAAGLLRRKSSSQ